jgi:hypothetical protein
MLRIPRGALVASILLLACTTHPAPAGPSGPANLMALDGEWLGTYQADVAHGRSGAIMFRLNAAEDVAQGCAILRVGGQDAMEGLPMEGDIWGHIPPERLLLVVFNRAADGAVRGSFAPYPDPVCGCEMKTVLTGHIRGNVIEGTYVMEHASGGERMVGKWRAVRRAAT